MATKNKYTQHNKRKKARSVKNAKAKPSIKDLFAGVSMFSTTGLRTGGSAVKEDFIGRIKEEVQDAKDRGQKFLWAYWHYNTQQMMFIDHKFDFVLQAQQYADQDYFRDPISSNYNLSEIAAEVGAKACRRHIYINRSRTVGIGDDLSFEPVAIFLGERVNAFNEFVTIEFEIF